MGYNRFILHKTSKNHMDKCKNSVFLRKNAFGMVFPQGYWRTLGTYTSNHYLWDTRLRKLRKGDIRLAQETIDAIRKAEAAAEAAEKDAVKEAEEIVVRARAQAAELIADMTRKARELAAVREADARTQGEAMMQTAQTEEVSELEALRSQVASKREQAVKQILAELL